MPSTSAGAVFRLKDDSVCYAATPSQEAILNAAAKVYAAEPQALVVTSANDGEHMAGSRHYEDLALDLRVWNVEDHVEVAEKMQDRLGRGYDVIPEWRDGEVPSHIHAERDA